MKSKGVEEMVYNHVELEKELSTWNVARDTAIKACGPNSVLVSEASEKIKSIKSQLARIERRSNP